MLLEPSEKVILKIMKSGINQLQIAEINSLMEFLIDDKKYPSQDAMVIRLKKSELF
jgi:hypothetical protein